MLKILKWSDKDKITSKAIEKYISMVSEKTVSEHLKWMPLFFFPLKTFVKV